jgi:hypothetical protein
MRFGHKEEEPTIGRDNTRESVKITVSYPEVFGLRMCLARNTIGVDGDRWYSVQPRN